MVDNELLNIYGIDCFSKLQNLSNEFNINVAKGYYKDIRLSTMYESFEFSFGNEKEMLVFNMLHIPNKFDGKYHTEFRGGLENPFTLYDCFLYVSTHTKTKFTPEFIVWDKDVEQKIGDKKKHNFPKGTKRTRHRRCAY